MKKVYGRSDPFSKIVGHELQKRENVFSDSFDSDSAYSLPRRRPTQSTAKRVVKDARVFADVSNVRLAQPSANLPPKGKKNAKKAPKTVAQENIPNFDSLSNYSLVVQPVTPIKTHISTSTSTSDDYWNKYATQELQAEIDDEKLHGPVTSSPYKAKGAIPNLTVDSNQPQISLHNDSCTNSRQNFSSASSNNSCKMETRRAKRLRQRLGDSMNTLNTSTPEQVCRKMSRLKSPELRVDISRIPVLDMDDELASSIHHMSLNDSLHDSLREMHSPLDQQADEMHNLVDSHCQTEPLLSDSSNCDSGSSTHSLVSGPSSVQRTLDSSCSSSLVVSSHALDLSNHSSSLFTASYRTNISQLDSIVEEVSEECLTEENSSLYSKKLSGNEHSAPISPATPTSPTSPTSKSSSVYDTGEDNTIDSPSYHTAHTPVHTPVRTPVRTPASSGPIRSLKSVEEFSQERMNALIKDFQQFESPTLSELAYRRRERKLLRECMQSTFLSWSEYMPADMMEKLVKIGEGVYGEVFRYELEGDVTILKVVPMEGECTVNDEPQKRFHEMLKEIQVTKELSRIGYNFINTKQIVCIQGAYPEILLNIWDEFAERKESENDRPDYFTDDQHFVVFEFSDGGEALESYEFKNAAEGLSCLLQVGWTLALAEDECQFEHRDLHWSNILVARSTESVQTYTFKSSGDNFSINTSGIKINLIDFTLSRLKRGQEVVFFDLSEDETLFQGHGDYQFDVYRQMKDVTRNMWNKFHSVTNILWMRYLADKLLKMKPFPSRRGVSPNVTQLKKGLIQFYERSNHYHSAVQMVLTDPLFLEHSTDITT